MWCSAADVGWLGKKKSLMRLVGEGSIHCFLENAVQLNRGINVLFLHHHLYFVSVLGFLIAVFLKKVFALPALLVSLQKEKRKKK